MLHERIFLDPTDERVYIDTYVGNDKTNKKDAIIVIPAEDTLRFAQKGKGSR